MAVLTVIMKRGFEDDRVVVSVDGRVAFDREHVRLRRQIDRAAAFDCEVEPGTVDVAVRVPNRDLSARRRVRVEEHTTVLASIDAGRLELAERQGTAGDA
jgi:hypothetical protein